MPNIFKQAQQVNDHPKRNNFDLSKKINASFKFGTLYPVYCQPVVPGDSFSIDTAFNIKAMPVVFPVQTKMRAHMHYFYVRNKNLWNNWENWISNLPNATQALTPHPYISRPDSEFLNGSIHDFLGVPTSVVANSLNIFCKYKPYSLGRPLYKSYFVTHISDLGDFFYDDSISDYEVSATPHDFSEDIGEFSYFQFQLFDIPTLPEPEVGEDYFTYTLNLDFSQCGDEFLDVLNAADYRMVALFANDTSINYSSNIKPLGFTSFNISGNKANVSIETSVKLEGIFAIGVYLGLDMAHTYENEYKESYGITFPLNLSQVQDYPSLGLNLYSEHLHINALPYRAYESIYNAYYRNSVVDPLKDQYDNPIYNDFCPSKVDGADNYPYHLYQRNYELDFLTSALPSPQQGVAPMVGVTALGDITIEDENGITTARTESDEAGFVTKVVLTSPVASNDHSRLLLNIAASGFNINDFRNTNALQRFLETSIRKGYKYKDFIAGHFGIEPKYVELDMPEFIGGFSRDVNVSTIISNADTLGDNSGAALGEYGGYAQVVGGSNHSVRHYCDDYGYIMGIMCITPTPCYSQLLPKHMIAPDNFLDYYFAEFSNIGMQPITYKEVAPIQAFLDSLSDPSKSLEDTFGYQRPNYDMVAAVDEVHGDFRGSLRNYVINRLFDGRPELGHDFIAIRPEEVNDIFVDTDPRDDTFIGEIGFAVHAKRPVPRVVIPNLGR